MALIKCTECGKEISDKAITCPNCGCPVNPVNAATDNPVPTPSAKKTKRRGCLLPFIVFCFIVSGFAFVLESAIRSKSPQNESQAGSVNSTDVTDSPENAKQNARTIDEQLWEYVLPVINAHNQLMKIMGNESSTNLDIYNAAKDFEKMCQQIWNSPPEVSGDGAEEYLNSCRDYIIIEQTMAESLLKYIDSSKTRDLSKAQENIQSCNQALITLVSNRGTFLALYGFSTEEIQEITENLGIIE